MTVVWKHLTHPNIVPLLGVTVDPIQLVLESDVDLTRHLGNQADADRLSLVGVLSTARIVRLVYPFASYPM